jgi:dihydrodipicolinate synthase/N-acetylneuraminate lyase
MSAVLLPFTEDGSVAWDAFAAGVDRTAAAGLVPAVNMDTGYGPALTPDERRRVLAVTAEALGGRHPVSGWTFVAGAHVDGPGGSGGSGAHDRGVEGLPLDLDGYRTAAAEVADAGGVPVLFPSAGLAAVPEAEVAPAHAAVADAAGRLLAFELGRQFHPHGRIWPLATYAEVLDVAGVVGAKHSSLRRDLEWDRLALRDRRRPDFLVLTGNDLAIDMVRWGSDYLLGLSAFAPDAFAARDRLWAAGDARALAVDDALQALGALAFRDPVPAYRHDAALVWHRRGWAPSARVHPSGPTRPAGEAAVLATLLARLDETMAGAEAEAGDPAGRT